MLDLVSFTGADDATDEAAFEQFVWTHQPSVEMALLYFPEKEGTPRNPTANKRDRLRYRVPSRNIAAHLCGEKVFRDILADDDEVITDLCKYGRVQVNINAGRQIFTTAEVLQVYHTLWDAEISLILQCHADNRRVVERFIYREESYRYNRPAILFDQSKGKGVVPIEWPEAKHPIYCGYAGGLGPSNVAAVNQQLSTHYAEYNSQFNTYYRYWLDMESGVRTNNEFDLDLCQKVMDAVST